MHLTPQEQAMLDGEEGGSVQECMEILVALGKVFGAERLVRVRSAQIAGVSYATIGEGGLHWLEHLDAKVRIPAWMNPAGMDIKRWRDMGIDEQFAQRQMRVMSAYMRLGVEPACTCTPYYVHPPKMGEHVAWSESSAVVFANSVCGARTNREGGPSALCAAITGRTPCYGMHLEHERAPRVHVVVEDVLKGHEYGALGLLMGERLGSTIPLFTMRSVPTRDELKALGAAMAASGSVPMFHVANITPEAQKYMQMLPELERITIGREELLDTVQMEPEAVALGCPHCSAAELKTVEQMLRGKSVRRPLWVFTSRAVADANASIVRSIERAGAKVLCDTCMVVSPATRQFSCVMVNSGKAYRYLRTLQGIQAVLASTRQCIEWACGGR
ncbi:aconitase X [Methermicoccus shengliensis]|uniref:Phosphomevalonate dehydratase large subunit n=1 Tax=Methermicoccus shengliensis TaxID=660064 RepID=A0A832VM66_9EURY|nr:aconitase X catalytic domain-containing protein [Methermicoccus shengliensis]KUK04677.1 MAG: Uncharacterized protein XD46_0654 [Euryarchaeota archaeon 55_53]KUK29610.1 MAG: Uncharacterized protein XD62_1318 [Methanosarcinales archeaon 56_1174]MDI3487929.1 mevalonate 5-phosphate dehydratase large subunit [Methanosarcinales archaeon]MDN5295067.1 mevalonate 5-phosphate dehydratase large subunit [Methanosarcinales archaeon]HIH69091.1 DUF521 domain-containing protein [Methermicoccus shengliensis